MRSGALGDERRRGTGRGGAWAEGDVRGLERQRDNKAQEVLTICAYELPLTLLEAEGVRNWALPYSARASLSAARCGFVHRRLRSGHANTDTPEKRLLITVNDVGQDKARFIPTTSRLRRDEEVL